MAKNSYIYKGLMSPQLRPHAKLSKLIYYAYKKNIIDDWEFDALDTELTLLATGQNRSHNTIPRGYIEKELDQLHEDAKNESDLNALENQSTEC